MYNPEGKKVKVDAVQVPALLAAGWTHEAPVVEEAPKGPATPVKPAQPARPVQPARPAQK